MGFWKSGTGIISIGGQNVAEMNSQGFIKTSIYSSARVFPIQHDNSRKYPYWERRCHY